MKAIVCTKYGSPEQVLQLTEVPKPSPKEHEVLIKIHATAVNDYDWSMVRGNPYIYRLMFGFGKPKNPIPGMELSGVVEAVGNKVSAFKIGDEVYGDISECGFGSFAEYISIHEKCLAHKPQTMTFEEAASVSHASMLALQGLQDVGKIQEGQQVLINGAGGGVGTFGLQIAKLYNAEVTGVDTGDKLNNMSAIGFDHVIDYKQEDFTQMGQRYDLILDAKTTRSAFAYLRALKPKGKYVTVGGHLPKLLQILCFKSLIAGMTQKRLHIVALKANKDLPYIHQLFEEHKIKSVIDGPYPLSDAAKCIQHFGSGKHTGKVIISPLLDR